MTIALKKISDLEAALDAQKAVTAKLATVLTLLTTESEFRQTVAVLDQRLVKASDNLKATLSLKNIMLHRGTAALKLHDGPCHLPKRPPSQAQALAIFHLMNGKPTESKERM